MSVKLNEDSKYTYGHIFSPRKIFIRCMGQPGGGGGGGGSADMLRVK